MKTLSSFLSETPSDSAFLPDIYSIAAKSLKTDVEQSELIGKIRGLSVYRLEKGHVEIYSVSDGEKVIARVVIETSSDFLNVFEVFVRMIHISKSAEVYPGFGEEFFWKFLYRENIANVSDTSFTPSGKKLYLKILKTALEKNLFVAVYDKKKREARKIKSVSDAEEYFGKDKEHLVFAISSLTHNDINLKEGSLKDLGFSGVWQSDYARSS